MNKAVFFFTGVFLLLCFPALAMTDALNQDPKGESMKLVEFTPRMMDAPFQIQYPEQWHVREEYAGYGNVGIYFTREPILKAEDKYTIGTSVMVLADKFDKVSSLSFEEKMGLVIFDIKKQATIVKGEKITVDGRSGIKSYIENDTQKGIILDFVIGNHLFMIQSTAPKTDYDAYKDEFESITNSFKWQPTKKVGEYQAVQSDPIMDALRDGKPRKMLINGEEREISLKEAIGEFVNKEKE